MAGETHVCTQCGARFTADQRDGDLECDQCGSREIERFVDSLYAKDLEYVGKMAGKTAEHDKESGPQGGHEEMRSAVGKPEGYICRRCGFEFVAIPGSEEAPECPECASDEIERLERATYGGTTEEGGR
jgi:DNA-directed RNA polymerase subunit RPC12/RpoP